MKNQLLDITGFLKLVLEALEATGVEYMIGGTIAEWAWGEPRATQNLDIVIKLPVKAAGRFSKELEKRNMLVPVDIILDAQVEDRADIPLNAIHTDSGLSNSPPPYLYTARQHPHLDDDADGLGSHRLIPGGDGDVAKEIFLGFATLGEPEPVEVTQVGKDPPTPLAPPSDTALLWAKVSDQSRTEDLWVEIRPPGLTLPGGSTQQTVDLTQVSLDWIPARDCQGREFPGLRLLHFKSVGLTAD